MWLSWGVRARDGKVRGLAGLAGGAMEGALDSEPGTGGLLSRPWAFQLWACPHFYPPLSQNHPGDVKNGYRATLFSPVSL